MIRSPKGTVKLICRPVSVSPVGSSRRVLRGSRRSVLLTALSKTSTSESVPQSLLFPGLRLTVQPQLDRGKVLTEAKKATGKLLVELQVRKSTADGAGAREFYTELTKPPPEWEGEVRDLVLKKKLVCVSAMALLIFTENSSAASKDFYPTKHLCRERRGCPQRIPTHSCRSDREFH